MQFYLASKSPRRKELLTEAGFDFEVILSSSSDSVDESVHPNEAPSDYVHRVTRAKALWGRSVVSDKPAAAVLAADTTVALNGKIYGKPESRAEATRFLKEFSGKTHEVLTAVCLIDANGIPHEALSKTLVTFRALSPEEIEDYVSSKEPFDEAGGYGIQGRAGKFVVRTEGSYSGVIGLPLSLTKQLLADQGIVPLSKKRTSCITL